ncbi:MAG: hypothetical protein GKR89_16660 [Candidatus Latescibacteria bacterium]|nr:hypothetical protein [Candidatus Latescibacterota bacterium]
MKRLLTYILGLLVVPSAWGLDTLVVGRDLATTRPWKQAIESVSFVELGVDSVWTWSAGRGDNLSLGLAQRGGTVGAKVVVPTNFGYGDDVLPRDGLEAWVDGDPSTAWGPDLDEEVGRQADIYLDLGATFRVDRIRFFPRLDSEHSGLILGAFEIATNAGEAAGPLLGLRYSGVSGLNFSTFSPNRQPVVEAGFERRDVRYIRLSTQEREPWEIAEFEVFAEGTIPPGEVVSAPLFVRGAFPIWGQVRYDGGEIDQLPITIQTRTGSDDQPLHYFLQRGDELEQVSRWDYINFVPLDFAGAAQVELGPIRPNPGWSPWQTVVEGQVLSPAPRRFLQFRVLMPAPATALRSLFFEYVAEPLADELAAEISPLVVEPGTQTRFTLSMEVQLDPGRGDTGFRYIEVRTPAAIGQVEQVLVDDQEVVFTPTYQAGQGFTVDIWRRILQSGSFVQLVFTAAILRDGTPFQVRALDLRLGEDSVESVYQTARPEDVDPLSVGGELVVRLLRPDAPLIDGLQTERVVITPNGDGVNDIFAVAYNLLKLTRPVPVFFQIFDLAGRLVVEGESRDRAGRFARLWAGEDGGGGRVPPGQYIYRIKVEAEAGTLQRAGVVDVVY